ncbi:MAG: DUF3224 domain-containing protein [Actinomycetota bacterium]
MKISGSYSPTKWEETLYGEIVQGKKTTKVAAEFAFTGDIEGTGNVEYLMSYSFDDEIDMMASVAEYVGQIKVTGSVKGKSGTFVLLDRGAFAAGVAKSAIEIAADSGTGELTDIAGSGSYKADETECVWELSISG